MKLSLFGRLGMALFASLVLGLGMTACGGGTIGYLWVLGQQYNQIAGFKIDDYTGNLTDIIGEPFSSNGSLPVSLLVKPGGRYVYVLNQGTCPAAGCGTGHNIGGNVAVFSVGGDGVLTFQQSFITQGYDGQWLQFDSTGTYLYVLDKYSPGLDKGSSTTSPTYTSPNTDGNGAISSYAIDSNTGRLTLVLNSQVLTNNIAIPFFEVGGAPFMMKTAGGSCLFTMNAANQSVTPYALSSGGQLVIQSPGQYLTQTVRATSITTGGSYVFITDAGLAGSNGNVQFYTVGSGCNLSPVNSGYSAAAFPGTYNPVWAFVDSTGKYLYVLNQSSTCTLTTCPYSSISAFSFVAATNQVQQIAGAPYTVGAGPVCMLEDPTNQYMYISNFNDGTVTGKFFDPNLGTLSDLKRGSTFPATGHSTCLAVSGAVQ